MHSCLNVRLPPVVCRQSSDNESFRILNKLNERKKNCSHFTFTVYSAYQRWKKEYSTVIKTFFPSVMILICHLFSSLLLVFPNSNKSERKETKKNKPNEEIPQIKLTSSIEYTRAPIHVKNVRLMVCVMVLIL